MKPEQSIKQIHDNQPRKSRLFNAIASFGIFYTLYDVAATVGNNIHTATNVNASELAPNNITLLSVVGAAASTLAMDRFFRQVHKTEQQEQTGFQSTNQEPGI
jgi:hypothetical protein